MKPWGAQANEQALSDERIAGVHAHVVAAAARAFAASWPVGAVYETEGPLRDLLAACDATSPSPNRTHTVVAVDELETLRAIVGDMGCGLEVGGNDDENLGHYLARLRLVVTALGGAS